MNLLKKAVLGIAATACVFAAPAYAVETTGNSFTDALVGGDVTASLRYRYAAISQDGFSDDAAASTYQFMLAYETAEWAGLSAFVQGRHVGVMGPDDYNSTVNGNVGYPVEADPETTEVDQLFLRYNGIANTSITVGRRKLIWGNQRFVSNVGWRQNHQSFDGFVVESTAFDNVTLRYAYSFNVNRVLTDESTKGDFEGDFHLFNAVYDGLDFGTVTGYAYLTDHDDPWAVGLSSQTYGLNFTGSRDFDGFTGGLVLEYARQTDFGSNPASFDHDYYRIEPSLSAHGFTAKAGYEVLSGNGSNAFQTPFALLHGYNGWADMFLLGTPAGGLEDLYGSLTYRFGDNAPSLMQGMRLTVAYHDFEAEATSSNYGTEWDAAWIIPVNEHFTMGFKYADYDAEGYGVDTQKAWWFFTARY